ncbi:RNA-binding domain-containing protein [Bacteroidota bacterium]
MYPLELKDLIFEGESTTTEFKRKFTTPYKIAKEISALANTKGGYIIFGVDDDGSLAGVENEKGEIDYIEQACGFHLEPPIIPLIEIISLNGKDIVVVKISESNKKPHRVINNDENNARDVAYVRVGEQSVIASREMVKVLEGMRTSKPLKMSIGENEKRLFTYLENHKKATVIDFAKLCNISKRRASQLIVRLVRAGILLIHQDAANDYFTLNE